MLPPALFAAILPFIAPSLALSESIAANNASLLWGPYRPSLYLGIRPRMPESLLMGLMWGKLPEADGAEETLRYTCGAADGMASYGWTAYDTRTGGTQTIQDVKNSVDITTEFIKKHDGQSAGNWALRVRGIPRAKAPAGLKTSVVFYVGMEAMDTCQNCKLKATVEKEGQGDDLSVKTVDIEVKHPILGTAGIHFPTPRGLDENGRLEDTAVRSMNVTTDMLWKSKSTFLELLKDEKLAPKLLPIISNEPNSGNMHYVQMNFENGFEFDVLYSTLTSTRAMTSAELTREVESTTKSFKKSFSYVFPPRVPFNTESHTVFAETMFSNLLGGLGYFQGTSQVDRSHAAIYAETTNKFWEKSGEAMKHSTPEERGPYELLTHTPSRAVFPRGFLWDEGFHLLPVLDWDADLAIEVVRGWLALMDEDGWIAREQIIGMDAQIQTPEEYIVQYPHIANPPTMFWVVSRCIDILQGKMKYFGRESTYLASHETGKALIKELYPLLKKHYDWFRRTQSGDVEGHSVPSANLDEGYRWRGRKPEVNLASGLDDYPRVEPPDVSELHIDALCWVGVMAQTLAQAALYIEGDTDITTLRDQIADIRRNIDTVHWSKDKKLYCDTVVRDDTHTYVCAKGYISLFPLLTGFIGPDHANLPALLDLIYDPKLLWTDHGVRSLSADSPRYGVGDNYWRSPIWININFLLVERLYYLAKTPGPSQQRCKEIYTQLRRNLVDTVYTSYMKTGFAWEQYDPFGRGQRTQHFTGWTSLVVKIMAMPDMDVGEGVRGKMKDLYDEARVQVERNEQWGVGSLGVVVLLLAFFYVYRRRFKGTLRGLRRKM